MTPQREEAERFLRLARRDQAASVVLRKLRYMHHWTHLPHPQPLYVSFCWTWICVDA